MIYGLTQAQIDAENEYRRKKIALYEKDAKIDRTETNFGGKGILTKEQYEQAMALSKKMRDMSSW